MRKLIALTIVAILLAAAGSTLAGKPSTGAGLAVVMVADTNGDGAPNWGERIKFTVKTTQAYPVVSLSCSRSGSVIYGNSLPYYWPNPWDSDGTFTLSSAAWSSGAADCTALLKASVRGKVTTLSSLNFHVNP